VSSQDGQRPHPRDVLRGIYVQGDDRFLCDPTETTRSVFTEVEESLGPSGSGGFSFLPETPPTMDEQIAIARESAQKPSPR
jgi:hypothetical protein